MNVEQLNLWKQFKQEAIPYPEAPFPVGFSPCHYFSLPMVEPFRELLRRLPNNPLYLELGSFLGAGSTLLALEAREDLYALCVDNWAMPSTLVHKPYNVSMQGKQVDFLKGKGSQLQHFMNNTFAYRARSATLEMTIDVQAQSLITLAKRGLYPDMIMIDDDHHHDPVLYRLAVCCEYWPKTVVILDDHHHSWPGVITGLNAAVEAGYYKREDCVLYANRMMCITPKG